MKNDKENPCFCFKRPVQKKGKVVKLLTDDLSKKKSETDEL